MLLRIISVNFFTNFIHTYLQPINLNLLTEDNLQNLILARAKKNRYYLSISSLYEIYYIQITLAHSR